MRLSSDAQAINRSNSIALVRSKLLHQQVQFVFLLVSSLLGELRPRANPRENGAEQWKKVEKAVVKTWNNDAGVSDTEFYVNPI